jgi:ketosteroid isomerase-like protein
MQQQLLEISEKFAKEHVDRWVAAWNSRDLEAVLAMYSDDIEFSSPKIKAVFPEAKEARVRGKKELRRYWSAALGKYPNIHFSPVGLAMNGDECFFEYVGTYGNTARQLVVEKFEFGGDGLVVRSSAFYGAEA